MRRKWHCWGVVGGLFYLLRLFEEGTDFVVEILLPVEIDNSQLVLYFLLNSVLVGLLSPSLLEVLLVFY
jgi:hypothetical protein